MADCPICNKHIEDLSVPVNSDLQDAAGSLEMYRLYRHVSKDGCLRNAQYKCPVCLLRFASGLYKNSTGMQFAVHWGKYGHLAQEEHVILSAMEEN